MDLVQYDDKTSFIFGLSWSQLDPNQKKNAQIKEFLAQGFNRQVTLKNEDTVSLGLGVADDAFKKNKTKKYSAAAAIANIERFSGTSSLFVIEEEGDDRALVALVGLINGNVVLDVLVDLKRFSEYYDSYQARCFRNNVTPKIYGSVQSLALNLSGPFSWGNLVVDKKSDFNPHKNFALSTLRTEILLYLFLGVVAVLVIAYAGWYGYNWWRDSETEQEAKRQALLNSPEVKYRQALVEILNKPQFKLNTVLPDIEREFHDFPTRFAGFGLQGIECKADPKLAQFNCVIAWHSLGGTFREFTERAPKEWFKFDSVNMQSKTKTAYGENGIFPDYKIINHQYIFKTSKEPLELRTQWMSSAEFYVRANDFYVNSRGFDGWEGASYGGVVVQGIPVGMTPGEAERALNAIYGISWEMKYMPYLLADLLPRMSPDLTIKQFSFRFPDKQVLFSASGVSYVTKK